MPICASCWDWWEFEASNSNHPCICLVCREERFCEKCSTEFHVRSPITASITTTSKNIPDIPSRLFWYKRELDSISRMAAQRTLLRLEKAMSPKGMTFNQLRKLRPKDVNIRQPQSGVDYKSHLMTLKHAAPKEYVHVLHESNNGVQLAEALACAADQMAKNAPRYEPPIILGRDEYTLVASRAKKDGVDMYTAWLRIQHEAWGCCDSTKKEGEKE